MQVLIDPVTAAIWEWTGSRDDREEEGTWDRGDIETVVERVNKGAQLLDHEKPGWREEVMPDSLDMRSGAFCIIGQTYGEFNEYVGVPFGLGMDVREEREVAYDKAAEHGFLVSGEDDFPYALLDLVWVSLLQERADRGDDSVFLVLPPAQPRNVLFQTLKDANQLPV